jgi:hypothetical protein
MDDHQTNPLLQLLNDPECDPDVLASLAVQCFGTVIAEVVPHTFLGVHRGAVVLDLSACTRWSGASSIRIVYFTLEQLQQLPYLLDYPDIMSTVQRSNPLFELLVLVVLPETLRLVMLTKEVQTA